MQFQIPQFIETEDKIVGPFSLREFLYIGVAAGISFFLYFMGLSPTVWFILTAVVLGVGIALAFVKVNGRPLMQVSISALSFYWNPQTYVWQPEHPTLPKTEETLAIKEPSFSLQKVMAGVSLRAKAHNLQTGTKTPPPGPLVSPKKLEERFEIVHHLAGDQQAARRVDYH